MTDTDGFDRRRALAALGGMFLLPAAAADAAPALFMVFFDAGSAQVDNAVAVIAGQAAKKVQKKQRVTIAGYCDTAEKNADKLSLARAAVVVGAMVAAGVEPSVVMTVLGKGAAEPRVATGPNVDEPQNRRVEIVLE